MAHDFIFIIYLVSIRPVFVFFFFFSQFISLKLEMLNFNRKRKLKRLNCLSYDLMIISVQRRGGGKKICFKAKQSED